MQEVDRAHLDAMAPGHQGLIAVVRVCVSDGGRHAGAGQGARRSAVPRHPDGVTDPHNLGAIIRSADVRAHGDYPERRAVG